MTAFSIDQINEAILVVDSLREDVSAKNIEDQISIIRTLTKLYYMKIETIIKSHDKLQ